MGFWLLIIFFADNDECIVERRPNDFYSLDVKLTEFHGTFTDAQLPPRKLLTTRLESIQVWMFIKDMQFILFNTNTV